MPRMQVGLDRLADDSALARLVREKRVGLLAHPASVDRRMRHARDILERIGAPPAIIFGPEHGYGGEAQDMIGVADARDRKGTPVRSLYGERYEDLLPREADLKGLDLLVIDLQDVGSRYYTFVWTAVLAIRACAKLGVRTLVLDRPNPIGQSDETLEGRLQKSGFCSFVGLVPIPIRHGLTLGEIAAWRATEEKLEGLEVIAVQGISADADARAWDRPFVLPSPNMPTYETALVYPGGCLLEGTNLSDGRGTTRPFEITGAPWIDGWRLAKELNALGLPGFVARPVTFRPTFHKHAGIECGGVQIHVLDARAFRPVAAYVALLAMAHRQAPDAFRFRTEKYEFVDDIPALDLLTGSAEVRTRIASVDNAKDIALECSQVTDEERRTVHAARKLAAAHHVKS